jgi:RNA recognition motif-containing protein
MRIFVGNLPFSLDDEALLKLFAEHGEVDSAQVMVDRYSGKSRGFGFVQMSDPGEAQKAIDAIDGTEVEGREIKANEARPRENRGGPMFDRGDRPRGRGDRNRKGRGGGRRKGGGGGGGGRNRW